MEQLLKSANTFLHILEVSNSTRVACWEISNIIRALSWADHHQNLYHSYASKTKIRSALDTELRKLAYRSCILVNAFNFKFLENCKDFLLGLLRNNPALKAELLAELPESSTQSENTQLFKCSLNINKKLNKEGDYTSEIVKAICSAIGEAISFQKNCQVLTHAPQRAITTLLTRVFQLRKVLLLQCFLHGDNLVKESITSWVGLYGSDLWFSVEVPLITKCSASYPAFCKLHIHHILDLFKSSWNYKHCHLLNQTDLSKSKTPDNACSSKELIFGRLDETAEKLSKERCESTQSFQKRDNLKELTEHLVVLHATSCCHIVEELLATIKCHNQFGSLATFYLSYLNPSYIR